MMLDHLVYTEARFSPLRCKLANECHLFRNHLVESPDWGNITIVSETSLVLAFPDCAKLTYSFAGSQRYIVKRTLQSLMMSRDLDWFVL